MKTLARLVSSKWPWLFTLALFGVLTVQCQAPTATPASPTLEVEKKPVIKVALDSDIDHIELMEFRSDGGYHATANLYEPLIAQQLVPGAASDVLEGTGKYGPGLGEVTLSDDKLVATVKIRPGAKFANGDPITSRSFKHTFDRAMLAPRSYVPLLVQFMGFESPGNIVVVNDYTLEFRLDRPSPLFLPILSFQTFGAMDPETTRAHATRDDPWAFDWYRQHANASGPYMITQWRPGVEYVFEPNPYYWQGANYFHNSGVIAEVVPSAQERERLLKQNAIDLALGLPFSSVDQLKADPNVKVYTIESRRLFYVGMNNTLPPFDNPLVRQAVSYAIPYDAVIQKVLYGYAQPATSIIPIGMPTHTDEFRRYHTDLGQAKALLAAAGRPDGFEVELAVRHSTPSDAETAKLIQSALAQIGIRATIADMDDADFLDRLNRHALPFFIHDWYSWGNDPAFQLTFLVKCGAFTNYANYCNKRVDQIIEEVTWTADAAKREQLMREAQQIITAEAPWAFLYQPDWIVAARRNFTGLAKIDELTLRFAYMGKK